MNNKEKLKKQVADGKVGEVLQILIRHFKEDSTMQNTAYLQSGRWNSINDEIYKGIVTRESSSVELNRIKDAVLRMIDEIA